MTKTLVIAEKPSVAADIAKVVGAAKKGTHAYEGDSHIVSWAVGHLLEFQKPEDYDSNLQRWRLKDLPIIPDQFQLTPVRGATAQLKALKKMIRRKDVAKLVNACDAGREGELIFREIYRYAETEKPVDRLWLQSMTSDAIKDGMSKPRTHSSVQGLADAADCRAECDWLIGMNATRALTIRLRSRSDKTVWSAGRVQTATLAMLVRREREILAHEPRPYWLLKADFSVAGSAAHQYLGTWFDPKGEAPRDRIYDPEQRDRLLALLASSPTATATESRKTSRETAPALLDLTTLQREANKRFGFSARRTLSAAQSLYEQYKLLTYPRTDSKALPEDYRPFVKQSIEFLATTGDHGKHAQRLLDDGLSNEKRNFNNQGVSDHFAIIPTGQGDPSRLHGDEVRIFDLVARRFLASFHPPAQYAEVDRTTNVDGELFRTRRKILTVPGWRALWEGGEGKGDKKDQGLAELEDPEGTATTLAGHEAEEKLTRPPARHTEASLLRLMETAGVEVDDETIAQVLSETGGLGTPATRADIIETLLKREYADRCTSIAKRKALRATSRGIRLVEALERIELPRLTQPELTGDLEEALRQVERGDRARDSYMKEIKDWTQLIVEKVRDFSYDTLYDGTEALGSCPDCGSEVHETLRTYSCAKSGRDGDCKFIIWKEVGGRYVDRRSAEQILHDGVTPPKAGFFTREGREYEANLKRSEDGRIRAHSSDNDIQRNAEDVPPVEVGPCPFHPDKKVWRSHLGYRCEEFEGGGCKLSLPLLLCQRALSVEEITVLIGENRSTALLEGFISKRNRPFSATLKLSDAGRIQWDFPPRSPKSGGAQSSREFPINPAPVAKCPYHAKTDVVETATDFVCNEDGCKLSVPREICKRELTRDEAAKLFSDNTTEVLEGFTSKAGKPFAATLYLKRSGRHGFRFQNRK